MGWTTVSSLMICNGFLQISSKNDYDYKIDGEIEKLTKFVNLDEDMMNSFGDICRKPSPQSF